jgi:hypothetical protein
MKTMYRIIFIISLMASVSMEAQELKPSVILSGGADYIVNKYARISGIGGHAKLLLPLHNENFITLSTGYSRLFQHKPEENTPVRYNYIPIGLGYRVMLDQFYVEPQLGYGLMRPRYKLIMPGLELGYMPGKFNLSLLYQAMTEPNFVFGDSFQQVSFRVGYRFGS